MRDVNRGISPTPRRRNSMDTESKTILGVGCGFLILYLIWFAVIVWGIIKVVSWITSQ